MYGSKLMRATCAAILLVGLAPLSFAAEADAAYEVGLQEAQDLRYAQALEHFTQAATRGHRDAMRTAGLMLLYGEDLYGPEVHKDWIKAMHLLAEAAKMGCMVSSHVLKQVATREHG